MILYKSETGKTYALDYQELREKHLQLCALKDYEFMRRLPEALHLACVICYLKGYSGEMVLQDEGIIHQLVHLLHIPDEPLIQVKVIRKQFKKLLHLS